MDPGQRIGIDPHQPKQKITFGPKNAEFIEVLRNGYSQGTDLGNEAVLLTKVRDGYHKF